MQPTVAYALGVLSAPLPAQADDLVILRATARPGPIAVPPLLADAQGRTVERTVKGAAGKDVRLGVYINVKPDCTSGPLPTIRLTAPPAHGRVTVKRAKVNATNYKQCLALQVPGYIAFYRAAANFSGSDVLTLEVKFASGLTEIQRITVMIGGSGQPI